MREPYQLLFFSLNSNNLSEQDYNKALKQIWISTEYPNADKNVSVKESLQLFKKSNPDLIMDQNEKNYLNSLPDEVTIYRGTHTQNNSKALSWTANYDKAKWFANRFDEDGYILQATINKKDIVAFFNVRNEDELIVDFNKIKNLTEEKAISIKI